MAANTSPDQDMLLDFRTTVVYDIVPPPLVPHFLHLFDAETPGNPVLVWAAIALVADSPRWAATPVDSNVINNLAACQEHLDFDDDENAMTCLVFVLIHSPLLLALAKKATDDNLAFDLTKALITIREYRHILRKFTTIYKNDEHAGPLVTALDLPGHVATQPTISTLPPVLAVRNLIDIVGANQWGNNTAACKTYARNAIEQVYRLDDNRVRAAAGENLNIDKEILQWMVLIGRPPANFQAELMNSHLWVLILCHWATVCAQRQTVWYFTGFAGRLFNKFWSENESGNQGEEWSNLKAAVVRVIFGLGGPVPTQYAGARVDISR